MNPTWRTLLAASTVGSLLGCTPLTPVTSPIAGAAPSSSAGPADRVPVQLTPVPVWRTGGASGVEAAYLQGRAAHGSGQLAQARQHYQDVLNQAPRHVGALNALAVIEAQEGNLPAAMARFEQAMALAPGLAHLHNNAGYALLRAGRLDEAQQALERAQALDPANRNTRRNLAEVQERLAAQAARSTPQRAEPQVVAVAAPASAQLVNVSPNVYELRLPAAQASVPAVSATASVATAATKAVAVAPRATVRMEIANGAGVAQLARRTADRLAPLGWVAARLSNAKPYRQQVTEIQFGSGQQASAQALLGQLPVAARTVAVDHLNPGVQMRLVLGHDLGGRAVAAWLDGAGEPLHAERPAPLQAARPGEEGWTWG